MELIRISGDKIKISLTKAELEAYDMSVESMDYGNAPTRRAFRELFVEAREQTGFETDGEKVFVQIFRAKNGGCEIFVSKIKREEKLICKREKRSVLYEFAVCEDMIALCKELDRIGYDGRSDAYVFENAFYLLLEGEEHAPFEIAAEYALDTRSISRLYIDEHFSVIREGDAVSLFSQM